MADRKLREFPLLTAHWLDLVMLNYTVDPRVLRPYLPRGTELDLFEGECLMSLVGFRFDDTRLWGYLPIWGCRNFAEINLRFYVTRRCSGDVRRGVVFIKELAPGRAVCRIARLLFNENYHRAPVIHRRKGNNSADKVTRSFIYEWVQEKRLARLSARTCGPLAALVSGSVDEFIAEHYWGYSRLPDGRTLEYRVTHPSWQMWHVDQCQFDADVDTLYGSAFCRPLAAAPFSALVASGSRVAMYRHSVLN